MDTHGNFRNLPYSSQIVSQDPVVHLNCRVHQVIASVAAQNRATGLLFHSALRNSHEVFRHCYLNGLDRWSFPVEYVQDHNLARIGFQIHEHPGTGPEVLRGLLDEQVLTRQPVFFFAQRSAFEHQVRFLRDSGGGPGEYAAEHSFMVCGVSRDELSLLIRDDCTHNHDFADFDVSWAAIEHHAAPKPGLVNRVAILRALPSGNERVTSAADLYRQHLKERDDELEILDIILDQLPLESRDFAAPHLSPAIHSLAILSGCRILFDRFLRHSNHSADVRRMHNRNARAMCEVLDEATASFRDPSQFRQGKLKQMFATARTRERRSHVATLREIDDVRVSTEVVPA